MNIPVSSYSVGAAEVLWESTGPISVPANGSTEVLISYPAPDSPPEHITAASWVAPVAGTDYTAVAGLSVSSSTTGESLVVTVTNTTSSAKSLASLEARGEPLINDTPYALTRVDADSVDNFGTRLYPSPSRWHTSQASAASYADTLLSRHASLAPVFVVDWRGNAAWETMAALDLSRRITITADGVERDVHIEGIGHRLRAGNQHIATYFLTPVPARRSHTRRFRRGSQGKPTRRCR